MSISKLVGGGGCEYLSVAAHTGKRYFAIVPEQDTIFTVLSGINTKQEAVNFLAEIGLTGVTVKQGAKVTVPDDCTITTVTLSSGSAFAYKK